MLNHITMSLFLTIAFVFLGGVFDGIRLPKCGFLLLVGCLRKIFNCG
jgi:hypothetical protein